MSLNRVLFVAAVSLAAALLIASRATHMPIEERLVRLQVEQLPAELASGLRHQPVELQARFVDYMQDDDPLLGLKAWAALHRYPRMAGRVLELYGDEPLFREVLSEHGEHVIPPIHYFLETDIRSVRVMRGFEDAWQSMLEAWEGLRGTETVSPETPADAGPQESEPPVLDPVERGRYAILFIHAEGHDFLGQFVVGVDGKVGWVQTERALEGLTGFFTSGTRRLEERWRRGEDIEAGDLWPAVLDLAIVVSAVKVLRMGAAATRGASGVRAMSYSRRAAAVGAGLWRGSAVAMRLAAYGAPLVLAYVAVRHPSVLNSVFSWAGERIGLPAFPALVAGWALLLFPLLLLLRMLLRPFAWLLGRLVATGRRQPA